MLPTASKPTPWNLSCCSTKMGKHASHDPYVGAHSTYILARLLSSTGSKYQ
jgi:hypothetical protein